MSDLPKMDFDMQHHQGQLPPPELPIQFKLAVLESNAWNGRILGLLFAMMGIFTFPRPEGSWFAFAAIVMIGLGWAADTILLFYPKRARWLALASIAVAIGLFVATPFLIL